jgi:hypothetical protein
MGKSKCKQKGYQRKTRDLYDILQRTVYGVEVVCTETSWADCKTNLKLYREADPRGQYLYRKYRERIAS